MNILWQDKTRTLCTKDPLVFARDIFAHQLFSDASLALLCEVEHATLVELSRQDKRFKKNNITLRTQFRVNNCIAKSNWKSLKETSDTHWTDFWMVHRMTTTILCHTPGQKHSWSQFRTCWTTSAQSVSWWCFVLGLPVCGCYCIGPTAGKVKAMVYFYYIQQQWSRLTPKFPISIHSPPYSNAHHTPHMTIHLCSHLDP